MGRRALRDPYNLVGTTLGRCQVQELIGIGGMSAVYRAQHLIINTPVALKVLKPELAIENSEMIRLFLEEAATRVNLNHPSITKITDVGITSSPLTDDTAFLVMEWLEGHTLEDELKERGSLPIDRVTVLLEQICEGLAYVHSKGIVHRDLKPSNIMIVPEHTGDEAIKILDFGLSKASTSALDVNTRVMGAPYYSSPEQLIVGATIDHRSDIYSLGVIAYQMITGKLPFDSDAVSIDWILRQHLTMAPQPLRQFKPGIPASMEKAVLTALAKRPEDRYVSVIEFARDFGLAANVKTGSFRLRRVDSTFDSEVKRIAALSIEEVRASLRQRNIEPARELPTYLDSLFAEQFLWRSKDAEERPVWLSHNPHNVEVPIPNTIVAILLLAVVMGIFLFAPDRNSSLEPDHKSVEVKSITPREIMLSPFSESKPERLINIIEQVQREHVRDSIGTAPNECFTDSDLRVFRNNQIAAQSVGGLRNDQDFIAVVHAIKNMNTEEQLYLLDRGQKTYRRTWQELHLNPNISSADELRKGQTVAGQEAERLIAEAVIQLVKQMIRDDNSFDSQTK